MVLRTPGVLLAFVVMALAVQPAVAQEASVPEFQSALVLGSVHRGGRTPIYTNPLEALRVAGDLKAPAVGDEVQLSNGETRAWRKAPASEGKAFKGRQLRGAVLFATVTVEERRAWMLRVVGASFVLANGAPRMGDLYGQGITEFPVMLEVGVNEFFFQMTRSGSLEVSFAEPRVPLYLSELDRTLPDALRGAGRRGGKAGIILVNATEDWSEGLAAVVRDLDGQSLRTSLPSVPPLSRRKVQVRFELDADEITTETVELPLELMRDEAVLDARTMSVLVREQAESHVRTYLSEIDGSVQPYAVTPPSSDRDATQPLAMYLSLHGASVHARAQAAVYEPKPHGVVVAPMNRREFGFDWEDWGRIDALEVLSRAEKEWGTDKARTYLTGHSMGGHGTWRLGSLYPARFAAIAPSAGWRDFWGYGSGADFGQSPTGVAGILDRAANQSRTLLFGSNLAQPGVYILHGDADESVPVDQARFMRSFLADFHTNWAYYERVGAGHWWGDECVDWPPLFDFLRQNQLQASPETVDFTTVNPGVSSRCDWVEVSAQEQSLAPTRVEGRFGAKAATVQLTTSNASGIVIHRGAMSFDEASDSLQIEIDGSKLIVPSSEPHQSSVVWLRKDEANAWQLEDAWDPAHKTPARAGPFKNAFRRRMTFVVGTTGTAAENEWAFAKARFDAEQFLYRGNGAVDIMLDTQFNAGEHTRNVILYGNRTTNAAWGDLLRDCPIAVERGRIVVGDRELTGSDLACVFVYPRAGSTLGLVAVVGGTGLPGMRCTDLFPYFRSGCHYPDWTVISTEMLTSGVQGVRAAGFFGSDWRLDPAQSAWREDD